MANMEELDSVVTKEEILSALLDFKIQKAPGPDGIVSEILKHSMKNLSFVLQQIT